MKIEPQRTCPSCGNEFSAAMESCPVCMLRKGFVGGVESGESSSGDTFKPIPDQPAQRFDHYELATGEDGKPLELGRGAMGVTYKAFDINLRCPVTLKVISERYLAQRIEILDIKTEYGCLAFRDFAAYQHALPHGKKRGSERLGQERRGFSDGRRR
jgi:hypothetical protein